MRIADGFLYLYLPPTSVPGLLDTFVQVKYGPGILRYIWVMDDASPTGSTFNVYDGILGPPQGAGLPPSVSGLQIMPLAINTVGPMNAGFETGLVVQYTNNSAQLSGFVSYR